MVAVVCCERPQRQARPIKIPRKHGNPSKIKDLGPYPHPTCAGVTLVVSILPPYVLKFTICDSATARCASGRAGSLLDL